jgi:hypothetical protein
LAGPASAWAASYNLEVLVFQNLDASSEEVFPEDPGRIDTSAGRSFPAVATTLSQVAQTLRRSPSYRVLYHHAWRQPGYSPGKAVPVAVFNDEASGAGTLEGTISLNKRRFLHADVDLWFEDGDSLLPVRMQQSRRMRSKELHYLDHPRLGVLIIARPVATGG